MRAPVFGFITDLHCGSAWSLASNLSALHADVSRDMAIRKTLKETG